MKPRLRALDGGPDRDTRRCVADLQRRLRGGEVRAIAYVVVLADGGVGCAFAGHRAGHFNRLGNGIAQLEFRFRAEAAE